MPKLGGSLQLPALDSLSQRDRRLLLVVAVGAVALLLFGVILPLDHAVSRERARLAQKKADLAWMQSVAPQLQGLAAPPSESGESLLVIIDRSARESGLAGSLAGSEPGGSNSLSVRLEKAPFDVLVAWLARLSQQNGVLVDAANIDQAGAPGLVNATITLHTG